MSSNGSTFYTGLIIDRSTGQFKLPIAPKFSAYTNFDNYIAANTWTKVQFNNADSNDQSAFDAGNNRFATPFAGIYTFGLLPMPLLILPSCVTTTASVGTDAVACSAFEPIRWSKKDTDDTIRQAKEHNATWAAVCGPIKTQNAPPKP